MAAFKLKKTLYEKVVLDKVPENKSKIKFTIQFSGEFDFNKDIAGDQYEESMLSYEIRSGDSEDNFKTAFCDNIIRYVYNSTGNIFDSSSIIKFSAEKEAYDSFAVTKQKFNKNLLEQKKKELQELENKVVELKKQLSEK